MPMRSIRRTKLDKRFRFPCKLAGKRACNETLGPYRAIAEGPRRATAQLIALAAFVQPRFISECVQHLTSAIMTWHQPGRTAQLGETS